MTDQLTREHTGTGYTRGTRTRTRTQTQVAATRRAGVVRAGLAVSDAARVAGAVVGRGWAAVRAVVTPSGWFVATWAVAGLTVGLVLGWVELLVGGLVAVMLVAIAALYLIGREPHEVSFALGHDSVVAGEPAQGSVAIGNARARIAWPTRIDLPIGPKVAEVYVPTLRGGERHTQAVELPTERRGVIDVGPAMTFRSDPFRLVRREFTWSDVHTLYVHPQTVALPGTSHGFVRDLEGTSTRILSNEDISFHAVREYTPGDARRHVHWKSTAKTGRLMVRQFEQTRRSTMAVVLDLDARSYAGELEFELAVSAAASLALRAIRDGRDVAVVASGHVPRFARASVRSLAHLRTITPRALLDDMAGVEMSEEVADLDALTRMVADSVAGISIAMVVTGSRSSTTQVQTAAFAFPADVAVAAVLVDPVEEPSITRLGRVQIVTIGLLGDLRGLMSRAAAR